MNNGDLISVELVGFAPAQQPGSYAVFLKEIDNKRCLPIVVGGAEAHAISMILNPQDIERPLTHDTLKNIIDALRGEIRRVVVTKLEEHTFFADIWLVNAAGDNFHLDARPSDAIAIALRNGAPICVARDVMDEAGTELPDETKDSTHGPHKKPTTPLGTLESLLQRALDEENYEEAARLRDQIRKLKEQGGGKPGGEE